MGSLGIAAAERKGNVSPAAPRSLRGLPLEEIGELTRPFRERLARRHDLEQRAHAVRASYAFDDIQTRADCYAVYPGPLKGPKGRKVVSRDSPNFVLRVRRRWRPWRDAKGRAYRSIEVKKEYVPAHKAHATAARWHEHRAGGQRHRVPNVENCGKGKLQISCSSCGSTHEMKIACGVVRLCQGCNVRRSKKMKAKFAASLAVVTQNAARSGMFNRFRKGGALSEHHLVLTIPHIEIEPRWSPKGVWGWTALASLEAARKATAIVRNEKLFAAWRDFSRRMQAWYRKPWSGVDGEGLVGACWHRAFEWTPGADGMGHPHFHVWMLSPWMPELDDHRIASIGGGERRTSTPCKAQYQKTAKDRREAKKHCPECAAGIERRTGIRTWWADALKKQGIEVDPAKVNLTLRQAYVAPRELIAEVQKPGGLSYKRRIIERLEIRSKKGGDLIDYFEGWTIDSIDQKTLAFCGADVIAGVFESLEGKRLSQSSRVTLKRRDGSVKRVGFLGIAETLYDASCDDCNAHSIAVGAAQSFPAKDVKIQSWQKVVVGEWSTPHKQSDALSTGPPLPPRQAPTLDELIAKLRRSEKAEARLAKAGAPIATLVETCELVRAEGRDALPVYRRAGSKKQSQKKWSFRERMKFEAKQRRAKQ